MSLNRFSLTDGAYLPEPTVTGDSEFRDAAVGRAQRRDKELDGLIGQVDSLLRAMREDAAECGLDDIAEHAEEAIDGLTDWLSDDRHPLGRAVEEAGEEQSTMRALRAL